MNDIYYKIKEYFSEYTVIGSFIFTCLMLDKVLAFKIPQLYNITYITIIYFSIKILLKYGKLDNLTLFFLAYLPITIIIGQPDSNFNPWERYLLFVFLMICCSPLVINDYSVHFRFNVLRMILWGCLLITTVCFICYFLGISYMKLYDEDMNYMEYRAGTFSGITTQSMTLGPICGISFIYSVYQALKTKKKHYWILSIVCFSTLLFSASRSSLIATLVAIIILLYFFSSQKNLLIKKGLLLIAVCILTYPLWSNALEGINQKNRGEMTEKIDFSSREGKWEARINEFKESPLFGIGFVSVKSGYDINGNIEPGSSWLAVLSMTGIIGFVLFSIIYFRGVRNTIIREKSPDSALLGAILILIGVHMITEGHVFSAGSFLCFVVWLIIGCSTDYQIFEKI